MTILLHKKNFSMKNTCSKQYTSFTTSLLNLTWTKIWPLEQNKPITEDNLKKYTQTNGQRKIRGIPSNLTISQLNRHVIHIFIIRQLMVTGGSRPSSRPASRPASRPSSRPASRTGSKPPSRYGSTQSLDSTDESGTPSRIPRRSAGTTGNTPTSSRHNSVSGRKLGAPVNGSSSRSRTPTGLLSPASGVPSR